jgi:hypothetical protein
MEDLEALVVAVEAVTGEGVEEEVIAVEEEDRITPQGIPLALALALVVGEALISPRTLRIHF